MLIDGGVHDATARLWAQAERIRAYLIDRAPADATRVGTAIKGLRRFLRTPVPGLWLDRLKADDCFVPEPARATSLYDIVGAVAALIA